MHMEHGTILVGITIETCSIDVKKLNIYFSYFHLLCIILFESWSDDDI
jgi:hypothetical protein